MPRFRFRYTRPLSRPFALSFLQRHQRHSEPAKNTCGSLPAHTRIEIQTHTQTPTHSFTQKSNYRRSHKFTHWLSHSRSLLLLLTRSRYRSRSLCLFSKKQQKIKLIWLRTSSGRCCCRQSLTLFASKRSCCCCSPTGHKPARKAKQPKRKEQFNLQLQRIC